MIIDFHTHVFPDIIAKKTITALAKAADEKPSLNGTVTDLLDSMQRSGVDKSVIMPVNTRPGQFESITRFAKAINDNYNNLISFAGIHPDDEDIPGKMAYLKENDFKGIKIHPDYTNTFIDDERYIRILSEAKRQGLIVLSHSGKDPAFDVVHCTPERGMKMLSRVKELVPGDQPFFIFAHLGDNRHTDDVIKHIAGKNCYIDISCTFSDLGNYSEATDEEIVRVIKSHGADKILFATDSPWNDQKKYIERLKGLKDLSDTEKELILGKNAERLLK